MSKPVASKKSVAAKAVSQNSSSPEDSYSTQDWLDLANAIQEDGITSLEVQMVEEQDDNGDDLFSNHLIAIWNDGREMVVGEIILPIGDEYDADNLSAYIRESILHAPVLAALLGNQERFKQQQNKVAMIQYLVSNLDTANLPADRAIQLLDSIIAALKQ